MAPHLFHYKAIQGQQPGQSVSFLYFVLFTESERLREQFSSALLYCGTFDSGNGLGQQPARQVLVLFLFCSFYREVQCNMVCIWHNCVTLFPLRLCLQTLYFQLLFTSLLLFIVDASLTSLYIHDGSFCQQEEDSVKLLRVQECNTERVCTFIAALQLQLLLPV